ncbi:MAG: DUF4824 family protein [Nitrospiraceae bacterium]
MMQLRMWVAMALMVATNAVVLGGVVYNRSGEPEATVTLTEREIPLAYAIEENSGLELHLDWRLYRRGSSFPWDPRPGWFHREKLEAVGYDCSRPLTDPSARLAYEKALPRQAFAVLEYEGEAWRAAITEAEHDRARVAAQIGRQEATLKDLKEVEKDLDHLRRTSTRLAAVDVGLDPVALRSHYPDRGKYLIVQAEVRLTVVEAHEEKHGVRHPASLRGVISAILVDHIAVPRELHSALGFVRQGQRSFSGHHEPRYRATVNYGRRYEPWVETIQPIK